MVAVYDLQLRIFFKKTLFFGAPPQTKTQQQQQQHSSLLVCRGTQFQTSGPATVSLIWRSSGRREREREKPALIGSWRWQAARKKIKIDLSLSVSLSALFQLPLLPDRTFRNFRASKSGDRKFFVVPKRRSTDFRARKF